jgi:hypothetical protein
MHPKRKTGVEMSLDRPASGLPVFIFQKFFVQLASGVTGEFKAKVNAARALQVG